MPSENVSSFLRLGARGVLIAVHGVVGLLPDRVEIEARAPGGPADGGGQIDGIGGAAQLQLVGLEHVAADALKLELGLDRIADQQQDKLVAAPARADIGGAHVGRQSVGKLRRECEQGRDVLEVVIEAAAFPVSVEQLGNAAGGGARKLLAG